MTINWNDPVLQAAVIAGATAILAGFVGGWIGGRAATKVARMHLKDAERARAEARIEATEARLFLERRAALAEFLATYASTEHRAWTLIGSPTAAADSRPLAGDLMRAWMSAVLVAPDLVGPGTELVTAADAFRDACRDAGERPADATLEDIRMKALEAGRLHAAFLAAAIAYLGTNTGIRPIERNATSAAWTKTT